MENMIPLNGRIAIVDDQIEQALPLMRVFAKNCLLFKLLFALEDLDGIGVDGHQDAVAVHEIGLLSVLQNCLDFLVLSHCLLKIALGSKFPNDCGGKRLRDAADNVAECAVAVLALLLERVNGVGDGAVLQLDLTGRVGVFCHQRVACAFKIALDGAEGGAGNECQRAEHKCEHKCGNFDGFRHNNVLLKEVFVLSL